MRIINFFLIALVLSLRFQALAETSDIAAEIPEAVLISQPGHLEIQVGKSKYVVEEPGSGESDRLAFDGMPPSDQAQFTNNRLIFLKVAARALHLMKYGFGIGSVSKEKILYRIQKIKTSLGLKSAVTQPELISLRLRSEKIIASTLIALDRKLWQQAPLMSRSNEFGIMVAGGAELLVGKSDHGWGGLFDIGISIGFNRDTKSLAIQIFQDRETYKSSLMPAVFIAGAVSKAGIYVANQESGELSREGSSFYPPMAPAFSSITKSNFMSGFSSGLTWPPSPIGDMLTYTDKLNQTVLLRLTVSPLTKGFVRLQTGLGAQSLRIIVEPVGNALNSIRRLFTSAGTCSSLFAN